MNGMNFPFICIPFSAGTNVATWLSRRNHEKRSQKYVDPRNRDTIRSNCLAHYGPAILDRRRPAIREWSESFLLRKRSENTIILVSAMRKRERCDCTCGSYGAMENTEILSLFAIERICRERRLIFRAAFVREFTLIRQTCLFDARYVPILIKKTHWVETLFIMLLIRWTSGVSLLIVIYSLLLAISLIIFTYTIAIIFFILLVNTICYIIRYFSHYSNSATCSQEIQWRINASI